MLVLSATFEEDSDSAYVEFPSEGERSAASQRVLEFEGRGDIVLDFDEHGRLLGLEFLGASEFLSRRVLDLFAPVGDA